MPKNLTGRQTGTLHIGSYKAAGNQFTETLSTTGNRQTWPSAMTFRLLPPTTGVAFHSAPGWTKTYTAQSTTPSHQFWFYQTTSTPGFGDGVNSRNVRKPHLNAAVCPRKYHCIHITVRVLQSCKPVTNYNLIMFNLRCHVTCWNQRWMYSLRTMYKLCNNVDCELVTTEPLSW